MIIEYSKKGQKRQKEQKRLSETSCGLDGRISYIEHNMTTIERYLS